MARSHIREVIEPPSDPLGGASGEKRRFYIEFVGKSDNPEFPYTVANELVASHLGAALGINVPYVLPHALGEELFVLIQMVDRSPAIQGPPPATAKELGHYIETHPDEVHGAIVFDLYIANNDRAFGPERRNLLLDSEGRLLLYDNGNSCFYRHRRSAAIAAGIPRLAAVEASLPAMFDMDHKVNRYREFLKEWGLVEKWCSRIEQLPDFVIESAVDRIPHVPSQLNPEERDALKSFLLRRKSYLFDHICRWSDLFAGLPPKQKE
jgi:hypothetical protein